MKRVPMVLCLGLLLVLTSLTIAAVPNAYTDKDAFYRAVDDAQRALDNGQTLTADQKAVIEQVGLGQGELDRFGGPDDFGYTFVDSDEENGPEFQWLDISETGTLIGGMGDDGFVGPFDFGFDFPYYGSNYDAIYLGFNGSVGFDTGSLGSLSHGPIPSATYPNNAIQFWQRDMHCNINGLTQVYTQQDVINDENVFIVEYNNINEYYQAGEDNSISCEIIFFEGGDIMLQYGFIGATVETGTMSIGIENSDGTVGLQYAFNSEEDAPAEGTAILFEILDPDASVTGTVTDMETGDPVEGAMVTIGNGTGETDVDGMYSIDAVYSGTNAVSILADGFMPYVDEIVVEPGDNVFDFELEPTAGPPPPVIEETWFDNFEAFPTVMGDQDPAWEWSTPVNQPSDAHSPIYIWSTYPGGNYNNNDDSWLYTTSEFFLNTVDAHVSYWHWYYYENSWDGYNFQISTDGGDTWTVLDPVGDYNDDSVYGLDQQPGWTGNGQNWEQVEYDLSDYLGETVMFAFRHGTDGSVNGYPGVAIDDFEVYMLPNTYGAVEGTVVNCANEDEPIEGATVELLYDGAVWFDGMTDVDGYFLIEDVNTVTFDIRVTHPDWWEADGGQVTPEEDMTTDVGVICMECPPAITTDPDNFVFDLDWGDTDGDILNVGNEGCVPLEFEVSITYLEDELFGMPRDEFITRAADLRPTVGTTIYEGPGSDEFAPVASEDRLSELDDPYFLVLQDNVPWYNTHQQVLTQLEIPFDVMGSGAMGTVELDEYTVILIASTQSTAFYNNFFVTNGDRFEEWVSNGGWLEFHGATQSGNDWTIWDGTSETYSTSPSNHVLMPEHPIMEGVPEDFTGNSASHNYITNVPDNADILAENASQLPTLIEYGYGRGNMLVCTMTLEWGYQNNQGAGIVMANMIAYSAVGATGAGGWMTVEPADGVVDPGDTMGLDVTIDTNIDDLYAGTYEALIEIYSNDPDMAEFPPQAWVTLTVTGGPPQFQTISLNSNIFELISSYIDPVRFGNDAETVFGSVEEMMAAYANDGGVYIPGVVDNMDPFDVTKGYRVYVDQPVEGAEYDMVPLVMTGDPVPVDQEYMLTGGMWNWLGYPFDYDVPVDAALDAIVGDLVIIMNDEGDLWIPDLINTMGMMTAGEGYYVITSADATFMYNAGPFAASAGTDVVEMPVAEDAPQSTGLPYAVLVNLDESARNLQPATIEIYDGNLLVGKSVYLENQEVTPVIAWGGSAEHGVAGFTNGNTMKIVVKSADGGIISVDNNSVFGEGAYARVEMGTGDLIPSEFTVSNGYPNPFNPSVTVPFGLPSAGDVAISVFNILGQQVYQSNSMFQAGHHSFVFDAGQDMVSGVYFVQVQFNGQVNTQKLMLLK